MAMRARRKGRRTYNRKRKSVKRSNRRKNRPSVSVIRGSTIVPDRLRTKLTYNTYVSFAGTTGVPFTEVYQSSCFDPDLTLSGNQPEGFDQWAAFYASYRVNGMQITVDGCNTGTTSPLILAVYPTLNPTPPGSVNGVLSSPYGKSRTGGVSTGNSKIKIKNYMSTKKIWGMQSIEYDDRFYATTGANPTALWYWVLYGYAGTGTAPTFQGHAKLTFYTEFFDRIQLDIS